MMERLTSVLARALRNGPFVPIGAVLAVCLGLAAIQAVLDHRRTAVVEVAVEAPGRPLPASP